MKKEYINEKKVGVVAQIFLFLLFGLIIYTSISGYTVLNFVSALIFLATSFSLYKKYQRTPAKLIIEEASLIFIDRSNKTILKTDRTKVKMTVEDFDYIELAVNNVKYYFQFGMKSKKFKEDMKIDFKKREKKGGIIMDALAILTD